jgi:peptidoglycan/xylan/chitin deacetylase (PgdA/CDA1 family)
MSKRTTVRPGRRPVVLMYHGFTKTRRADDVENLLVPEDALRSQLDYLLRNRWTGLDLDGFLQTMDGRARAGRSFLLTLDDGYRSVLEIAAPLLATAGVPAVVFVPSALLGGRSIWMPELPEEPLLSAEELRALRGMGIEIGAHGLDHAPLVDMSDAELIRQTAGARQQLADLTGVAPRAFAYPYGAFDPRARAAVQAAGFEVAFAVFDDAGPYAVSRVDVNATDNAPSFRIKLLPGYRRWWRAADRFAPTRRVAGWVVRGPSRPRGWIDLGDPDQVGGGRPPS